MNVFLSKFTPNAKAEEIHFGVNEVVHYQLLSGKIIKATIKSDLKTHAQCPLGYEALMHDDRELAFIDARRIVDWNGKR